MPLHENPIHTPVSRADGTIAFGKPRPPPRIPCTLCTPADSASSHDPYTEF